MSAFIELLLIAIRHSCPVWKSAYVSLFHNCLLMIEVLSNIFPNSSKVEQSWYKHTTTWLHECSFISHLIHQYQDLRVYYVLSFCQIFFLLSILCEFALKFSRWQMIPDLITKAVLEVKVFISYEFDCIIRLIIVIGLMVCSFLLLDACFLLC